MNSDGMILSGLRRCARQIKRAGRLATGRDVLYGYDAKPRKQQLGTVYGGWMIAPGLLKASSVMYSFGTGNDISFDLEVIEKFGMTVHNFDPSPEAIRWVSAQTNLPEQYIFHPYGLGEKDGDVEFYRPDRGGMYSLKKTDHHRRAEKVTLPVKRLPSIMSALKTGYLDLVKMDIEGAEYNLIDTLIENRGSIGQLLIEFHHRIGAAPLSETVNSVKRLRGAGFQLFHVSGTSSEFSFIRECF